MRVLGDSGSVLAVSAKALLLYVTAVVGFRVTERRTLAEMSPFDFVAAVAVGAIVGRVPNAHDAGYLEGLATLVTILAAHAVITRLRYISVLAGAIDHTPRLLVSRGKVLDRQMRRSGLTQADLEGLLRQRNFRDLSEVRYVIFEQRGNISVVPETEGRTPAGNLLSPVVAQAQDRAVDDDDLGAGR
ncbi:MAG: DUF421 domain-containing protein [Actinomycetota bacterium]|nr:DUF421 domain-containing protein [Actinomycetota bacterium]